MIGRSIGPTRSWPSWIERDRRRRRRGGHCLCGDAVWTRQLDPVNTILFGQRAGIMRVSANGGTPELIVRAGDGEESSTARSLPDGGTVLFQCVKRARTEQLERCASRRTFAGHGQANGGCESRQRCSIPADGTSACIRSAMECSVSCSTRIAWPLLAGRCRSFKACSRELIHRSRVAGSDVSDEGDVGL